MADDEALGAALSPEMEQRYLDWCAVHEAGHAVFAVIYAEQGYEHQRFTEVWLDASGKKDGEMIGAVVPANRVPLVPPAAEPDVANWRKQIDAEVLVLMAGPLAELRFNHPLGEMWRFEAEETLFGFLEDNDHTGAKYDAIAIARAVHAVRPWENTGEAICRLSDTACELLERQDLWNAVLRVAGRLRQRSRLSYGEVRELILPDGPADSSPSSTRTNSQDSCLSSEI